MPGNEYVFVTEWRIPGKVEQVADVLEDIESFPRWCPDVYLAAKVEEEGDAAGVGKRVSILSKGKLPYKLRWAFVVTASSKPNGFSIRAEGDFVGTGVWRLAQEDDVVHIVYDWRIRADKPLIRLLSPVLKPAFRSNHVWAMNQTQKGLREELARRYP